ncbi:MAG: hypothetical protein J1E33_06595 [Alistipes sp.]|nr:hypothetical protein [Alistipes sp.]
MEQTAVREDAGMRTRVFGLQMTAVGGHLSDYFSRHFHVHRIFHELRPHYRFDAHAVGRRCGREMSARAARREYRHDQANYDNLSHRVIGI